MKTFRQMLLYFFIFFILIGIFGNFQNNDTETEHVTYKQFEEKIEENKQKDLKLFEKEDGTITLKVAEEITYITQINPKESNINEIITNYDIEYDYLKEVNLFDSFFRYLIPILIIAMVIGFFVARKKEMGKANQIAKKNTKQTEIPKTNMNEVGGLSEETKKEINQIIEIFKNKSEAKTLGIRPAKGSLLYGPPGTGKTLLAKAMANSLGANFYAMSGSSFVEMFVGVGAKRVRELFAEARKNAPALIFIDEIDSVAKKRGMGMSNEERESTLNELLKQFDGVESNEDIFIIAATNRMDTLDPAILRPGRFDYKIFIGLPDLEGRKEIIDIHSKNKRLSKEVKNSLKMIAESTTGSSGADIESIFNVAAKHALSSKKSVIDMDDINHALDVNILGNQNRKLHDEDTKKRVAYHEAGHALVGLVTKPKSVRKATIIPRGQALGYVAPIPKELELSTPKELIDRISMILAGGVAEMKIYGEHSIGVSGDVEQAKNIIEKMVDLGMKDGDFVLTFNDKDKSEEMRKIYKKALEGCKEIIEKYETEFKKLANVLFEKETLEGEEIERIIYNLPEPTKEEEESKTQEQTTSVGKENEGIIDGNLQKGNI